MTDKKIPKARKPGLFMFLVVLLLAFIAFEMVLVVWLLTDIRDAGGLQ